MLCPSINIDDLKLNNKTRFEYEFEDGVVEF